MKTMLAMMTASAALLCGAGVYVDCEPDASFHWRTYTADRATVNWVFPDGARSARLVVTDMKGAATTNVVTSDSCSWSAPDADETVYDFTLDFYASADASGAPLAGKSLAARGIGAVRTASVPARIAETDARDWLRVTTPQCVLPLPVGATALARDGEPVVTGEAPGWYGWADVGDGVETQWTLDAVERLLRGAFGGTLFKVR